MSGNVKSAAEIAQSFLSGDRTGGVAQDTGSPGDDHEIADANESDVSADPGEQDDELSVGLDDISAPLGAETQQSGVEGSKNPAGKGSKVASKGEQPGGTKADKVRIPYGDTGKFIEIDYSDRDRIKQAFLVERQARQWSNERDTYKKKLEALDVTHNDLKGMWDTLEKANSEEGLMGVLAAIAGPAKAQEFIRSQVDRANFLRSATPEEKANLEARERSERQERELSRIRKEQEDFRSKVEAERDEAKLHAVEAKISPVYEKYNFSGKLGDENDEHIFNEMLWGTALRKLQPYEDKGIEITPGMVEKAFAETSKALRKRIAGYGEQVAAKTVARKKERAADAVQNKVSSSYRGEPGDREKAIDLLRKGDITSLFQGARTFGKALRR